MPIDPTPFREPPLYTLRDLAERAGVDLAFARRLFRALGFPDVADDLVDFSERDLGVAKMLRLLFEQGYAADDIVTVARTYGYSLSRVAYAEVRLFSQTFVDPLIEQGLTEDQVVDRLTDVVPGLLDLLDDQLRAIHRRHLAMALQQVTASEREGGSELVAAGFVDLVGFARLSNDLEGDDLEELISRFETLSLQHCVDAGAQVVKVIGDAVMFVASQPRAAVDAARGIVREVEESGDLPAARAGLDFGSVRPLGGDYFGRPINVAARLTGFARPGTIVISQELLDALPGEHDVGHIGRTKLKGVGSVRAYRLRDDLTPADD